MRVLHLSPHPDDELIASPAVLIALMGAGHEVVNLAVSLGRPEDRVVRERELRDACARVGLTLRICEPPYALSLDDDRAAAQVRLTHELVGAGLAEGYELIIAPSPHDGHHGHELVGRASVAAAAALRVPLWMWGLWSELALPTILHPFGQPVLERILSALDAHASQLARTNYRVAVTGRAQATAALAPERVFGFGTGGVDAPYAEALCEAVPAPGCLLLGAPRIMDPGAPLAAPTTTDISRFLHSPSLRDQLRG